MKIAIYSRKSKFTNKGESTQNQIHMCKDYANKHFDVEDFIIYEDEGFSGGNSNRPKYKKMIKDANREKFDVLICYRLDRISRNVADFSDTLEVLQDNNIAFVSVREQFDTSTPMGRAMMYIASVFAQLERETIAERIKDNMHQLARSGRWLGGRTPLGYKSQAVEYLDDNMNTKNMYKLSPIAEELETINKLYDKYIELDSLTKLQSYALENNIKTKTGKNFDTSILKIILTNPVYAKADDLLYEYFSESGSDIACDKKDFDGIHGLMVYNKHDEKKNKVKRNDISEWIIAVGKHRGVISSDKWIEVQKMLKKNSNKAPRSGTSDHGLLTGLIRCGECGSTMRVTISKKPYGIYHYYKCLMKERSRGSKCSIKNLSGRATDKKVVDELLAMANSGSELMQSLDTQHRELEALNNKSDDVKDRLEKELKKKEHAINNLTLQLAKNEDSTAGKYIIKQIENIDKGIKDIKNKLYNVDEEKEMSLISKNNIKITQELLSSFDNLDFHDKKKMMKRIVKRVTWDGKNLKVKVVGQK
ncbi:recombinase family protein [Dethiothermospora halolimnae]|uniref:recombinase family protein n=1 Tax=Dethiothermospora halolimnae TaxID=3114390 RepID=UPI003CCB8E8F